MAKAPKTPDPKPTDDAAALTAQAAVVVTDDVEAGEERPKAEGVLDVVKAFNLKEVNVLLALFEPPFAVGEIWAAGRAVIDLGEKLDGYLSHNRLPSFASHQVAATVTDQEIAAQVWTRLTAHATTAAGERPVVGADGKVAMDPILAGLIVNLATRALQMFLSRLGK